MPYDETVKLFDDWAGNGRAEGMERGHQARAVQALEAMGVQPEQRCLDLGCGNGWATRWLREAAGNFGFAAGVDASPAMVERAKTLSGDRYGLQFRCCAFDALPWTDSFDHAFSMEALYYAPDLQAALRRVLRALKPGGELTVVTDFFEENPHCHGWPDMTGVPMLLLSESAWGKALQDAGFELEQVWRCYDPRPVDADLPAERRSAEEHFRREVGSLALRGCKG